ncbi:hypothetical protein UA08_01677 [Talaromyces atroroseus]|uniref:Uncharacterized protein n=1 Tax=Talaromyces atroroseus TaxID=1441469 RepID=A0A1Q5Q9J2_TALAT|nr:hypothetical protein UA08_01677 [Talaromyces atroroseus]OKL62606.1 hypothetical protein UA08_01677 [Talaromyces atroroseus]
MKSTSALGVKRWMISKLNPPLPQTPRESQQLLSALTSSFRRQLDAADTNSAAQSTNQHLQTILQNPLFRVVPSKPSYPPLGLQDENASRKKKMAEAPMAFFDDLAAAGMLGFNDVRDCLKAQLALFDMASRDVRDQMKNTGAGKKVIEWFWTSDSFARFALFKYTNIFECAVGFMVAEGLHDQINSLIRELGRLAARQTNMSEENRRRLFGKVFRHYINADIHYGKGLTAALQTFNMFCSVTKPEKKDMFVASTFFIGRFIVKQKDSEQFRAVSVAVFDDFCKNLGGIPDPEVRLWHHAMQLYHPSHPDARPILRHAQDHHDHETSPFFGARKDDTIQVYLDAMRFLIEQKKHKDALRLSTYIEKLLSDQQATDVKFHDHSPELSELMVRANLALG